jgi:hypothetical protein
MGNCDLFLRECATQQRPTALPPRLIRTAAIYSSSNPTIRLSLLPTKPRPRTLLPCLVLPRPSLKDLFAAATHSCYAAYPHSHSSQTLPDSLPARSLQFGPVALPRFALPEGYIQSLQIATIGARPHSGLPEGEIPTRIGPAFPSWIAPTASSPLEGPSLYSDVVSSTSSTTPSCRRQGARLPNRHGIILLISD